MSMSMTDQIGSKWIWKPQVDWIGILRSGYILWGNWKISVAFV